jgi:hypothetical protein
LKLSLGRESPVSVTERTGLRVVATDSADMHVRRAPDVRYSPLKSINRCVAKIN